METSIVCIVAFSASVLTFFSGFGLGTLLTPVFLVFFPAYVAIPMSAIVHLGNNLTKGTLVWKNVNRSVLLRFGIPSLIGAFLGAQALFLLPQTTVYSYVFNGERFQVDFISLTLALLLLGFAIIDLLPNFKFTQIGPHNYSIGGLISGFFGGLSGHQGALRSAFLIHTQLTKEAFIATGVMIAVVVDVVRLSLYARHTDWTSVSEHWMLLIAATGAAMLGAIIGNRLFKKVTIAFLQRFVALALVLLAIALGLGWI